MLAKDQPIGHFGIIHPEVTNYFSTMVDNRLKVATSSWPSIQASYC